MTSIEALASSAASRMLPRSPAIAARMPSAQPSFQLSPAASAIAIASRPSASASSARAGVHARSR